MPNISLLNVLARSFLGGEQQLDKIVERGSRTLGRRWRWLGPLAERYLRAFAGQMRPRHRDVVWFLYKDEGFDLACCEHARELRVAQWMTEPQHMQPVAAAEGWDVPAIETAGALADWLGLCPGELDWFADLKGLDYKAHQPRLSHYRYRVMAKRTGHVRLIEAPKPRLKALQRQILARILNRIPSHRAAHGFVSGRSIATFAGPHTGRRMVLRMDLRDFFPSFIGARIQAIFRTMGYPESVADLLGGICTNAAPRDVFRDPPFEISPMELWEARALYARPHLPQGAPTSPALANVCAYRMDCRLTGLAKSAGATYTRYADDLAFSGDEEFERRLERFATHGSVILAEEGFGVNYRKTRIMRQGVRQHLAGLVANQRVNIAREDFDRLKATLTNCVRQGPEGQNRAAHPDFRAHLQGRVGFVEMVNPAKGKRLRSILEGIEWK